MSNPNKHAQPQSPNHKPSKKRRGARTLIAVGLSALAGSVAPGVASATADGLPEGRIQPITIESGKARLTAPQRAEQRAINVLRRSPESGQANAIDQILVLGPGARIRTAPHSHAAVSEVPAGEVVVIENPLVYTNPNSGRSWFAAVGSNKGNPASRTLDRANTLWVSDANVVSYDAAIAPKATFYSTPEADARLAGGAPIGLYVDIRPNGLMSTSGKDGGLPIGTISSMHVAAFEQIAEQRGLLQVNK